MKDSLILKLVEVVLVSLIQDTSSTKGSLQGVEIVSSKWPDSSVHSSSLGVDSHRGLSSICQGEPVALSARAAASSGVALQLKLNISSLDQLDELFRRNFGSEKAIVDCDSSTVLHAILVTLGDAALVLAGVFSKQVEILWLSIDAESLATQSNSSFCTTTSVAVFLP